MAHIYLAGGLFNAGQRLHNLMLEKHLSRHGHRVILPQRQALQYFDGSKFDTRMIAEDCKYFPGERRIFCVVNTDGADADSGTAVEYGIAIAKTGRAIVYRTDFRTDIARELGINAMFGIDHTLTIYLPCFFTELKEVDAYYDELAFKISEAINAIDAKERSS